MRIAYLEDDPEQAGVVGLWLRQAGHEVVWFKTGASIIAALAEQRFSAIILDWELPDINGDQVLLWIRQNLQDGVPVIFVSSNSSQERIVGGLVAGADDFLIKPVNQAELLARVDAVCRRYGVHEKSQDFLEIHNFHFDRTHMEVSFSGKSYTLTQKEFEITWILFRNLGKIVSRASILEKVWGTSDLQTRTIDTHISRLRHKLELTPEHGFRLVSVYGFGYRLETLS